MKKVDNHFFFFFFPEFEKVMASKHFEEPGASMEGRTAESRRGPQNGRIAAGTKGRKRKRISPKNSRRIWSRGKEGGC